MLRHDLTSEHPNRVLLACSMNCLSPGGAAFDLHPLPFVLHWDHSGYLFNLKESECAKPAVGRFVVTVIWRTNCAASSTISTKWCWCRPHNSASSSSFAAAWRPCHCSSAPKTCSPRTCRCARCASSRALRSRLRVGSWCTWVGESGKCNYF